MKKDIKDYLHFYVGSCDCQIIYVNETVKNFFAKVGEVVKFDSVTFYVLSDEDVCNAKLILRPLSDMTEEEVKVACGWVQAQREILSFRKTLKFAEVNYRWPDTRMENGWAYSSIALYWHKEEWTPEITLYLLSRGFDLFELIPEGLAIDKTTLK